MRRLEGDQGRSRGQSMVELALLFPILLLMLILIIDFSRAFYHSVTIAYAAREGAWVGTDRMVSDATIQAATVAAVPAGLVTFESVTPALRQGASGRPVTVTTIYKFTPLTPGLTTILNNLGVLSGGQLTLRQSAQMVIL